ncbi:MAG: helix-turn-helix transcriptional regulator [Campylobacterales bacterium]|nr:helix-turn-helix transcriptional regulator [Campylobacterales bacterium]
MMPSLLHNTVFENITDSNGAFTRHFHDTHTIGLTHAGLFKSTKERTSCDAYAYSTRIINPQEVHSGDSYAWQYTNFYPKAELLIDMYAQLYGERKLPLFAQHIVQDAHLYTLLKTFFHSVYAYEAPMESETKLIRALSYLIRTYAHVRMVEVPNLGDKTAIHTAKTYIQDNLSKEISLDDLSTQTHLSKYHFLRVFAKDTGLTPHQYIIMERVSRAKALTLGGHSLGLASVEAGFSDQSHFIRSFRKMYGYSPKELYNKRNFILYPPHHSR